MQDWYQEDNKLRILKGSQNGLKVVVPAFFRKERKEESELRRLFLRKKNPKTKKYSKLLIYYAFLSILLFL